MKHKPMAFAMEEAEVIDPIVTAAENEIDLVDGSDQEIIDRISVIEEGKELGESIDKVGAVMADSVEAGEGLPPQAAEIANVALEHFYYRLGYPTNKPKAQFSLEAYAQEGYDRLGATQQALENLKSMGPAYRQGMHVAQEGLADTLRKNFGNYQTKIETLRKLSHEAFNSYMKKGGSEGEISGRFAKYLGHFDAEIVTGDMVVKRLKQFIDNERKLGSAQLLSKLADTTHTVARIVSTGGRSQETLQSIDKMMSDFVRAAGEIRQELQGEKGASKSFQKLNESQVREVSNLIDQLANHAAANARAWTDLEKAKDTLVSACKKMQNAVEKRERQKRPVVFFRILGILVAVLSILFNFPGAIGMLAYTAFAVIMDTSLTYLLRGTPPPDSLNGRQHQMLISVRDEAQEFIKQLTAVQSTRLKAGFAAVEYISRSA